MTRALTLLALAACAGSPRAEPLPAMSPAPRPAPIDAASLALDAAAPACLPALPSPAIAFLEADGPTIHVCFATTACFTIDRHTSAIARAPDLATASPPPHASTLTIDRGVVSASDGPERALGGIAGAGDDMLVALDGAHPHDPPMFAIVDRISHRTRELITPIEEPCSVASWADKNVLVTTSDCDGGHVLGTLFGPDGKLLGTIGGNHPIDTLDALAISAAGHAAIIAPRAYALVLLDPLVGTQQTVVDLVPIQAESTPTPFFAAVPLLSGEWLVASATGGVGVVDPLTGALAKTSIIPRCADLSGP